MSKTKNWIFDFDGTLVDSEMAIYQCFQIITNHLAPERKDFAKNILIGPPLRDTASEILGPDHQDQLDEFVNKFIKSKGALADADTFTFTCKDGKGEIILGYSSINSNRI